MDLTGFIDFCCKILGTYTDDEVFDDTNDLFCRYTVPVTSVARNRVCCVSIKQWSLNFCQQSAKLLFDVLFLCYELLEMTGLREVCLGVFANLPTGGDGFGFATLGWGSSDAAHAVVTSYELQLRRLSW